LMLGVLGYHSFLNRNGRREKLRYPVRETNS
jgi:hypothetical protein